MNKKLLAKLKDKNEVCRRWKQEQETCEGYRDTVQAVKTQERQRPTRIKSEEGIEGNKKAFCNYMSQKETRENVRLLLLKVAGALVTQDIEKAEVLNTFFTSVSPRKTCLQQSKDLQTEETFETGNTDVMCKRIRLQNTNWTWTPVGCTQTCWGSWLMSLHFNYLWQSWWLGEVHENWRKANVTPIFQNNLKEYSRNVCVWKTSYRQLSSPVYDSLSPLT